MSRDIDIKDIYSTIKNNILFILSIVIISIILAVIYLNFQTPIYQAEALLQVKNEDKSNIKNNLLFTPIATSNTKENVELLKTFYINQQALKLGKVDYRVKYYIKGKFKTKEIFNNIPIRVTDIEIYDSKLFGKRLILTPTQNGFTLRFKNSLRSKIENRLLKKPIFTLNRHNFNYNQPIITKYFKLKIEKLSNFDSPIEFKLNGDDRYIYENIIINNLKVSQVEEDISFIEIKYKDNIRKRAVLYLDSLLKSFIQDNIKNKSEQNEKVLSFINEELNSMKKKLEASERELERYRISNKVIQPSTQATTFIKKLTEIDTKLSENNLKLKIVNNIINLLKNNYELEAIAPSLMELNEQPTLKLISYLQESELEKTELLQELTPKHPKIKSLDSKIYNLKRKINLNIKNLKKYLLQEKQDLKKEKYIYEKRLKKLPTKDRKLVNIKRDYEVSSNMYNFLLKKKAENEIRRVATLSDYKIIDKAYSSRIPISPKSKLVVVSFAILGFIFAVILAFLYRNDKVLSEEDIKQSAKFPIYGIVPALKDSRTKLGVYNKKNIEFSNRYRILRTDIQLQLDKRDIKNGVILISSNIYGEDKDILSANLGAIFQLANYKVIVVDFDLREASIGNIFDVENISNDICNYLRGNSNISNIIYPTRYKNLHIIPVKKSPQNPSELILSNRGEYLIKILKKHYDYIIINTPPIQNIPDTKHLIRYSNINLIAFKEGISKKIFIENLNSLIKNHNIKNIGAVFITNREKFNDL
jgi:capsular exopolysaccharide synthesis family protein